MAVRVVREVFTSAAAAPSGLTGSLQQSNARGVSVSRVQACIACSPAMQGCELPNAS